MTYIPEAFHVSDAETLLAFMNAHEFATVISNSADGPVASHLPVRVRSSHGRIGIWGHLARANAHWRLMDGSTPALIVFHGPHGYVSPSWYETAPAVPTWNYGVVHARGLPKVNEDEGFIRAALDELVERHETGRPEPWDAANLPSGFYERMLRKIVAFEMPVTRLDGKLKLGQNRPIEDRRGTIAGLEQEDSLEARRLAELMREHAGV